MPEPIDDTQLKAIAHAEIRSAMGELTGDLANERAEAMDYYYGEPVGKLYQPNSDRSSVVITTLRDTVEWMMPQLMRMFAQADKVVEFQPVGQEDEEAADQETQAINHVFWRQNEGFLVLYTWFKDALLQKNGTVKYWVEEYDGREKEEYDGLTDRALMDLLQGGEYEVLEHETSEVKSVTGEPLHKVVVERLYPEKKLCVANVPPEEFLISDDAKNLDVQTIRPRMVGHHTEKTASDLREMGFPDSAVEEMMKGDDEEEKYDAEWTARYNYSDEQQALTGGADYGHESQKKTRLYELYMDIDQDGDGYAELLKIYIAGDYMEYEECDHVPFACLTPYINPHKHHGMSEYDMVHDLQEIASQVFRNVLDNMYQTNNVRIIANENVDLDSLLVTRPGAPIYTDTKGPVNNDIAPFAPPVMWEHGLQLMEYLDTIRKDRTGIADETLGLNAETIANANTGVMLEAMEAARGKIELVARVFAETGIKWLFRGLHELARKNYDQELRYELRGDYVSVRPQEWKKRTDLTINVGTASGSQQKELMRLMTTGDIQSKMVEMGGLGITVLPMHMYQTAKEIAENLGAKDGNKYFLDPLERMDPRVQQLIQIQMPQQGPSPEAQALQANAQIEGQKAQIQQQKNEQDFQIRQAEMQLKREEMEIKQNIEGLKAELSNLQASAKNQTEIEKVRTDAQAKEVQNMIKGLEIQLARQMDKYKADLQSMTQLEVKAMDLESQESMDILKMLDQAEQRAAQSRQEAEKDATDAERIRKQIEDQQNVLKNAESASAQSAQAQEIARKTQEMVEQANKSVASIMDRLVEMQDSMNKPKEIQRDESGRPVAVGGKPIQYNDDGSIRQIG